MIREFTAQEMVDCVERELRMRQRVYPRWVESGKMTEKKAKEEIACMEQIGVLLRREAQKDRLI